MREIRELGEGVILIDQHPSKMSPSALGNLGTKFCMAMSLNQDVKAVADSMLLDRNQQRYLAMLQVGQAICRSDRLDRPILLNIPYLGLAKGVVRDDEVKTHMQAYLLEPEPENPGITQSPGIPGIPQGQTHSPLAKILLHSVAENPLLGVVQRFRKLGLKTAQGYKLLHELENNGLVNSQLVDGKRLHDLTQKGRHELGLKMTRLGRGGLEHRYWVERIKDHYMKNECIVHLEKDDLDLLVEAKGTRLAIQVETGKSDLIGNLMKLGCYPAEQRFMLATNKQTEVKLKQMLAQTLVPKQEDIQLLFVKDFLKSPPTN